MGSSPELQWLPVPPPDWRMRLKSLAAAPADERAWREAVALANYRLNFQLTNALAAVLTRLFREAPTAILQSKPERLAVLSSSTATHLLPALRVAALRRGIWVDTYENDYGQYRQELFERSSGLHGFSPTSLLFCLDAGHVAATAQGVGAREQADERLAQFGEDLRELWRMAQERFNCNVLQQSFVPRLPHLLGANEHRHPASPAGFLMAANAGLKELADSAGVDLVALDPWIARDGLDAWHSPSFWLQAKQEIAVAAAPAYGDLVARVLAARQGRVAKCCVLDLDNTLWGGVVGDDGAHGVVIGQGSAAGEAFLAMQSYVLGLRQRGIILAVCSKNDEDVARGAFAGNPDMLLKESDFSCFLANWDDKAANLRKIAQQLNIGLDALAFVDDNPFERELVRRELPMVLVPELPPEPERFPACLADSGYFEGLALTAEDFARADYYQSKARFEQASSSTTDLEGYLAGLDMTLVWGRVDEGSLARTVQLVNKTNQFNLTTRRYSEQEMRAMMADPSTICLQLRLVDRFADNGLIAVVIGRLAEDEVMELDTWLMSCRVLGRGVEEATLNVVADAASRAGARKLLGVYRPTAKNAMVRGLYERLGFVALSERPDQIASLLELQSFTPRITAIRISEASA
jgi:FkbH-like protein